MNADVWVIGVCFVPYSSEYIIKRWQIKNLWKKNRFTHQHWGQAQVSPYTYSMHTFQEKFKNHVYNIPHKMSNFQKF